MFPFVYSPTYEYPLSGDVVQGISPNFFFEMEGIPEVEYEVTTTVASYGKQLGKLTEAVLALADKIDTLTGFWAIDEKPTGSKDPFALRRAALGVIRLVLENDLSLNLDLPVDSELLKYELTQLRANGREEDLITLESTLHEIAKFGVFGAAFRTVVRKIKESDRYPFEPNVQEGSPLKSVADRIEENSTHLLSFFHDRLKVYLRDQGIRHDIIDACIAMPNNDDLTLLVKRARALYETLATDDGQNLIQGFKRANNILTQAEEADGVEYSFGADPKFAETDEERALFAALDKAEEKLTPAMQAQDFASAMSAMAALRTPIDAFFEATQINSDNQTLRRNRLNLLSRIRTLCLSVADLTKIDG